MSSTAAKYSAQSLNDVSGLVAVVTGGGSGLGLIMAKALEAGGAKVFITGRRQEVLDEAVKQAVHGNITAIQGSTTDHQDVQRAVDTITQTTGYIDLLVCNAGVSPMDKSPDPRPRPAGDAPISEIRDYYFNYRNPDDWNNCFHTNVTATFTLTMAFLELLDAGNKRRDPALPTSQVITIGSVAAVLKFNDTFIYSASKAAVHHLMKNLGCYLVPHDIRTNIIAPGWFPSDMTTAVKQAFPNGMPRTLVPRQRMGNEEELAGTLLYLASKAGGYCNGNIMFIDGGVHVNHASTF